MLSFMISFMALYMCQVLYVVDCLGSRRMETAPTSIEVLLRPTQSQSDEPSDLRGSLSPTRVYSTWQSQAVTHPIMNRARRCFSDRAQTVERTPYSVSIHNSLLDINNFKIMVTKGLKKHISITFMFEGWGIAATLYFYATYRPRSDVKNDRSMQLTDT